MISVVIVNYNEASSLVRCIKSVVKWADEVVVIDLESTDESKKHAQALGARWIPHKFVPYVEMVREFAINQAKGDWILVLDPDEEVKPSLQKLLTKVSQNYTQEILNIPRQNIFFGHWIRHTNFWPDRQIRFFAKGTISWPVELHTYPKTKVIVTEVPAEEALSIKHYGYESFSDFLERQARYAKVRAQELYLSGERFSWKRFWYQPLREFLARGIKHQAYRDGLLGVFLVLSLMIYHVSVECMLWELEKEEA